MGTRRPDGGVPAAGGGEPDREGPAAHLDRLLGRASNAFELDDALLERLRAALMYCTELHSLRRRKGPPRSLAHRTLKHVFLLSDGGTGVLWEVEHNTGPGGRQVCEVYADREALDAVERRMREEFGEPAEPGDLEDFLAGRREAGAGQPDGWDGLGPAGGVLAEVVFDVGPGTGRRVFTSGNSPEHARRVLRRAENGDRPGEGVRRLLTSAIAHETTLVTMRHGRRTDFLAEWALYEHAFLLAGGGEVSLWELEHTMTPSGHPVCEVYLDEAAARDSADRHSESG